MTEAAAPPSVPDPQPLDVDVLTTNEMVELFGQKRVTIDQWVFGRRANTGAHPFPVEPDDTIGAFPVWRLSRLKAWAEATHRAVHEDAWREKKAAGGYSTRRATKQ
jgi:hypothetical protein